MTEPQVTFDEGHDEVGSWIGASFIAKGIEHYKRWSTRDGMRERAEISRSDWVKARKSEAANA
jgi:hypothetical protein